MRLKDQLGVCVPNFTVMPASEMDRIARVFSWNRLGAYWHGSDMAENGYDFANLIAWVSGMADRGVSTLVEFNYGNARYPQVGLSTAFTPPRTPAQLAIWKRWVQAVVEAMRPYPVAYEVWNEPYSFGWWGTKESPEEYAQLCRATREAVREVDPDVPLVCGGGLVLNPHSTALFDAGAAATRATTKADLFSYQHMTDYVQRFLDNGGADGFDALSMHPYRPAHPPEALSEDIWMRERTDIPLWFTELGWTLGAIRVYMGQPYPEKPTYTAPTNLPYTEAEQARYLARMYLLGAERGIERQFWFNWTDTYGNEIEHSVDPLVDNGRYPHKYTLREPRGGGTYFQARWERGYGLVEEAATPLIGQAAPTYYEDWRVGEVAVELGGSGFPGVTVSIDGGLSGGGNPADRATAKAKVVGGTVSELVLINPGSGYEVRPVATLTPSDGRGLGANFVVEMAGGKVTGFTRKSCGVGYTTPRMVSSGGGGGSGFTAKVTGVAAGAVTGVEIVTPGIGYLAPPGLHAVGGSGGIAGAGLPAGTPHAGPPNTTWIPVATAAVSGGAVTGVTVSGSGHGFVPGPTVTIAPPPGFPGVGLAQATAIALTSFTQIAAILVIDPGAGYDPMSPPAVSISGGWWEWPLGSGAQYTGGYSAAATAIVSGGGEVTGFIITNGGDGYQPHPEVVFTGGATGGAEPSVPAKAVALVNGELDVTEVVMIDGGAGYDNALTPAVEIRPNRANGAAHFATEIDADGAVTKVTIINGGGYYNAPPRLETVGGPGSAAGDCVVYDGKIIGVELTRTGGGFPRGQTYPALSVIHAGGGSGAVLRPVMRSRPLPLAPKPAFIAARTLFEMLGEYEYISELSATAGLYQQLWRKEDGSEAWACWCSESKVTGSVTLPDNVDRIRTHLGGVVAVTSPLAITRDPVYVILSP